MSAGDGEDLARLFHDTYERLAPAFGYKTRRASAVPWEQVPQPLRALMIAVAGEVGAAQAAQTRALSQAAARLLAAIDTSCGDGDEWEHLVLSVVPELRAALTGAPRDPADG